MRKLWFLALAAALLVIGKDVPVSAHVVVQPYATASSEYVPAPPSAAFLPTIPSTNAMLPAEATPAPAVWQRPHKPTKKRQRMREAMDGADASDADARWHIATRPWRPDARSRS